MLARISFYGLMLALVAGLSQNAFAQRQGGQGGRGGFGGGMGGGFGNQSEADLLNRDTVKEELNLSDDQAKQLREAEAEARKEMAKALRAKISSILTDGQKTRFSEIVAQSPNLGLSSPMIQETLKVSDDQKKKLTEIQTKTREEVRGLFSNGFSRESGEKMQEINKESEKKMADVLTSEQKTAFEKLKENKFEGGFGGGRGGQGGQGGNRGRNRDGGDKGGKRPDPEL